MARTLRLVEAEPAQQTSGRRLRLIAPEERQGPLPLPAEPPPSMAEGDPIAEEGFHPKIIAAARSGVVYDRPAPSGHFAASLAYDEEHARQAYSNALAADFGRETDVRTNEAGDLEYFSPNDQRYALVSPPGTITPSRLGGDALALGTEAAADMFVVLPAAMASGPGAPIVAWSGAAGAATLGDIVRMSAGKALGVNEDVSFDDIAKKAFFRSGAPAALMGPATAVARRVYRYFSGESTVEKFVEGIDLSQSDAMRLQDEFNRRIGGEKLRFSLAQGTGNEDLLAIESAFKKSGETLAQFRELSEAQKRAFNEFATVINRPYKHRQQLGDVTASVREKGEAALQRPRVMEDEAVLTKEAELDDVLTSLDSKSPEGFADPIRAHAQAERDAFRQWKDGAVNALETAAGTDAFIETPGFRKTLSSLRARSKQILLPELRAAPGKAKKGLHTFSAVWDTLSALKRRRRDVAQGLMTEGPDVGKIDKMIVSLERDLRTAMHQKDPRIQELYDQFRGAYAREKRRLDQGAVMRVMQTTQGREGDFRIQSDIQVFSTLLPPGGSGEEIFDLTKNSPRAMDLVRGTLKGLYDRRTGYDETGRVKVNAHRKFLNDYRKTLNKFFTRDEVRMIERGRSVEEALAAREVKRKKNLDEINNTFGARLEGLNESRLLSLIKDKNNPRDVSKLVDILQDSPDVLRGVRTHYIKDMMSTIRGPSGARGERPISHTRLDDFLHGKGEQYQNIKALFGETYAKDLDTLNAALQTASQRAQNVNFSSTAYHVPGNTVLNSLARAYVGIFTPAGRGITALTKIRARIARRAMTEAIGSPEDLRVLVDNARVSPRTKRGQDILSAFGASALMDFYQEP